MAPRPAPSAGSRGLRALAQRVSIRATRPSARRQQEINRGLLAEVVRGHDADASSSSAIDERREGQRGIQAGLEELREWLGNLQAAQDALGGTVNELSGTMAGLSERVPSDAPLHGEGTIELETFDAGLGGKVVGFRGRRRSGDGGHGVYLGFEDLFRGSEETISDRQRVYLPLLIDHGPVLDIGCGRGELLQLLGEIGIDAMGIDVEQDMVERCRAGGLQRVEVADAVSYLRQVADGSLGTIVALQVIEHLPYPQLVDLLRMSTAKLEPGGRLVVETVNPHAPQALKNFWIDPTHQHPLYPEIVVALCGLAGFARAFIWYPHGTGDPERDRGRQLDYAVVAETLIANG